MPDRIDPLTLRLFVAVCEERSIARAAARESLVASAVSKRIAAIETRFGIRLLVRSRRGIEPTAAGHALLRQAHEALGALERLHAELNAFAQGLQGSVRVAASVSALAEHLPGDVARFLEGHDSVRVSLDERHSPEAVRAVRVGSADLGVVWDAVDAAGLRRLPYRHDHLMVIMPPDHPLAVRDRVTFADTLAHPSVGISPGGLLDRLMQRQAALLGRSLVHRMQVSGLDAGLRIVAAGLGLAIVPCEATASQVSVSSLVMRPLAEPWARRRFVLLMREQRTPPAAAQALARHLWTSAGGEPEDGG